MRYLQLLAQPLYLIVLTGDIDTMRSKFGRTLTISGKLGKDGDEPLLD